MKTLTQKIKSTKGNLAVAISYPSQETDKLAILCPGHLDSKDYPHLGSLAEELGRNGYTTVRFDPTGTWDSDGDISNYNHSQYLNDIKSIIDDMLSRKNYSKIIVGGHSRGGQIAILYAARDPRVGLVFGIMPSIGSTKKQSNPIKKQIISDWEKSGVRLIQRDVPGNKQQTKQFRLPFENTLDADKYDVIADVRKIKVPIILAAGELDKVVTPTHVKEIFANANEPKKFILLKNIGHDYRHNDNEINFVNEKIIETLNPYL